MKTYNIFISHSWAYGDAYEKLIGMLKQYKNFNFNDFSVPKNSPIHNAPTSKALYNAIYNQMRSAHIVIMMAGKYATYSTWMQKEITIAKKEFLLPKPIIAIRPWSNLQTSRIVVDNSNELVGWNTSSIVNSIRSNSI